uniref:Uncharacterized protein n=1 Tax=Rhizophora mucronata TaxID=61149 RepID=A0A2P2IIJ1_RHIMU
MENNKLLNKYSTTANRKVANGLTNGEASEALPIGLFAGGNLGSEPVEGTTEVLGIVIPALCDRGVGAGAGANIESLVTEVGGAIRGGNCCGPGHRG